MHATDVIRRPLVTEKATIDSEENNRYAYPLLPCYPFANKCHGEQCSE